ncbi:hypothetical protein RSAG8_09433, partial [Rhizoctonia solani AG-8 WAC10335]
MYSHRMISPPVNLFKCNIKDLLLGMTYEVTPKLSFTGQPRVPSNQMQKELHASADAIRHFLTRAVFRRVSPVETRVYALIQNVFALVSITVLIFQTTVALKKAENGIRTRMFTDVCTLDGGAGYLDHFFEFITIVRDL